MLIEKIKADMIAAKKSGNKLKDSLLNTLLAEATMIGKNAGNRQTTDDEVITVIKKFIKNNEETHRALAQVGKIDQKVGYETEVLKLYLPQQLVREDLEDIIGALHRQGKNMGEIMKHLKENYAGMYDGRMASEIAKTLQ